MHQPITLTPLCSAWKRVRELLVVRLDQLGDLLMTTPALAALHESLPAARLTLLTSSSGAALARELQFVDDTLVFPAPWMRAPPHAVSPNATREMVDRIAAGGFDAAVIFTVATQSALPAALLCQMAGVPLRLAHCRENPYHLLTDWVPDTDTLGDGMRHEVQRQLDLVATVGCTTRDPRLRFSPAHADWQWAQATLAQAGIGPRYGVVHPGASAASRRWPAARFGAAARLLAQRSGLDVVFVGDASERELIEQARAAMDGHAVSLAGQLTLGQLGAVIGGAEVMLANNSGPMHMAAALDTPVVALYALTNPQHTPWAVSSRVLNHDVPCRHCLKSTCPHGSHDCLLRVEPEAVVDAAMALLAEHPIRHADRAPQSAEVAA